jgi:hypothetical protein
MNLVIGDFIESIPSVEEQLFLNFSIPLTPVKRQWKKSDLCSKFISNYLVLSLEQLKSMTEKGSICTVDSLTYVSNELLENALKYSNCLPCQVDIRTYIVCDRIILMVSNYVIAEDARRFASYAQSLLLSDLSALYISKIEENIDNPHQSGLGLLTIIHDHNVTIGWKFENLTRCKTIVKISTMAQLKL